MSPSQNIVRALIYLQYHSIKNRLVMRVKRLKRPKYLISAIFGALYFYFYFFRYLFGMRSGRRGFVGGAASPADLVLYESLGALVLLVFMLLAWSSLPCRLPVWFRCTRPRMRRS